MLAVTNYRTTTDIIAPYLEKAPVNLEGMAGEMELEVSYEVLADDIAGKIERLPSSGRYRITVNQTHVPARRRFTLAHEIAHFVLHRDLIGDGVTDSALYRSKLSSPLEQQANRFAADLLMPARLVRKKHREGVVAYADMAAAFDVSAEAMRIRMRQVIG